MDVPARRLRILYVEDHADTLAVVARLLRLAGHTVAPADSCAAARAAAAAGNFDLLVADLTLPDGDGLQLLAEMRARYRVPGIVVSGHGMPGDVAGSADAGVACHLVKPISFETLSSAINAVAAGLTPPPPCAAPRPTP